MFLRVQFGKEVSEVDMLSTEVLHLSLKSLRNYYISSLFERSHTLMQFANSINSDLICIMKMYREKDNQLSIIRKNMVVYIWKVLIISAIWRI